MRAARWIALLCLLAAAPPSVLARPGQEAERPAQESELERYLRLAREGSAVVRPQAAQRLLGMREAAAARLVELSGSSPQELAELGAELVEILGELGEPRLRAKLWQALADPDFPWRPSAARSLAKAPAKEEGERFVALLADPLAQVREAALQGVEHMDIAALRERVRASLADPDDRVRRVAAALLVRAGERCAVAWIREDLRREDRFFDQPTGKLARYKALELLERGLGDGVERDFGFDAEKSWGDPANAEAVRAIEEHVRSLCPGGLPELPAVARASAPTEGDVLGLEIRSCRKGEHHLRWSLDDRLHVGAGNAVAIELPEGSVARLLEAAERAIEPLGKQRLWGNPGCDLEQLHWRPDPEGRTSRYLVSKGQKSVEGLRPDALGELFALLVATLPEDGSDPRTTNLRARVREALAAVGGPLPAR